MAKLFTEDYFKLRVDNLLFYRYRNMMVCRTISGFTSDAVKNAPQYVQTRNNANEFGRVSSLCKQLRVALFGILPKQNNLAVVNSFTKKMRQVLECDTLNPRGERTLANALTTEEGRQLLTDYEFNPDTKIALEYTVNCGLLSINTNAITFPKRIKYIRFRIHHLAFDFETGNNELVSKEWVIGSSAVVLALPELANVTGVEFTLLEVEFYDSVNEEFAPMADNIGKSVVVVKVSFLPLKEKT